LDDEPSRLVILLFAPSVLFYVSFFASLATSEAYALGVVYLFSCLLLSGASMWRFLHALYEKLVRRSFVSFWT
jgi:hypothetical protein